MAAGPLQVVLVCLLQKPLADWASRAREHLLPLSQQGLGAAGRATGIWVGGLSRGLYDGGASLELSREFQTRREPSGWVVVWRAVVREVVREVVMVMRGEAVGASSRWVLRNEEKQINEGFTETVSVKGGLMCWLGESGLVEVRVAGDGTLGSRFHRTQRC